MGLGSFDPYPIYFLITIDMNIRIGNDIKLEFTLRGPENVDFLNVKQMRCYLINTSTDNKNCACDIFKRFPREPFPQFYTPSKYTLHGCGRFEYNVNPSYTKCGYALSSGFHDPHYWPCYNGFGINPGHFIDCHHGHHNYKSPTYLAHSELLEGENKACAYFPACEQIMAGPYKFVVVLVLYQDGWGKHNLHTYTIDYGTVFNLVCDESGRDGDIIINLDENIEDNSITRIDPVIDTLYLEEGSSLSIGQKDLMGNTYEIDLYLNDGSKIKYNPSDSKYILNFESDDEILTVNSNGQLQAGQVDEEKVIIVTITSDNDIVSEFTVHIQKKQSQYIGFANTTNALELDFESVDSESRKLFTEVDNMEGEHHVENFNSGYYLWIISTKEIASVSSSSFSVPLSEPQRLDNYYCYYCLNQLINTDFTINITLK